MPPNKRPPKGNFPVDNQKQGLYFGIFLVIVLIVFAAVMFFVKPPPVISYSEFLENVENGYVGKVVIQGQVIEGDYTQSVRGYNSFKTVMPMNDTELLPLLKNENIVIEGEVVRDGGGNIIWWIVIGTAIMFGLWFLLMRGGQGGDSGRAMSFGKSKARLHKDMKNKIKFIDVAGCDEAKDDLSEIVEFLKSPQKFTSLGARIPKGVMLVGPPGTGKTLLAKAVAGEANVPFFSVSGSEFVEMFVGVGASRVRDLFAQGRKNAPCIIFIDELDAVGRSRGAGVGGSHDEREQTLNQILVEMDGFDSSEGLILMAATNRPDILDLALLRPGRFDRRIVVDKPDIKARELILKVHTRKIPMQKDVNLEVIARGTPGLTGADIENLVNEAALKAARENRKEVSMVDFEFAREKVQMGPERKSRVILDEDKTITAYHESGHAVVSHSLPYTDPVHKITIIPRGFANGYMLPLPEHERSHVFKKRILQDLMVYLGGRAAEELIFGKEWVSAGASYDIEQATKIANMMVCEWGMSDELGPVRYGEKEGPVFLGKDLVTRKNFSEKVHEIIDNEVNKIISDAYNRTVELLKKSRKKLEALANAVLEKETLSAEEITKILGLSKKDNFPILAALNKSKAAKSTK
jgi:cell division protease FtsH